MKKNVSKKPSARRTARTKEELLSELSAFPTIEPAEVESVEEVEVVESIDPRLERMLRRGFSGKKIDILIAATRESNSGVPVQINGVRGVLERDSWTTVPIEIYELLKNCVVETTEYTEKDSKFGQVNYEKRPVRWNRFALSRAEAYSEAEDGSELMVV